jgi:VWFA-related protein
MAGTLGGIAIGGLLGRGGGRGPGGGPAGGPPGVPGGGTNRENGKENLKMLARRTGGAYHEVGKKPTLDEIFGRIEEELRAQYSLGYTPDANAASGYRRIKVDVRKKGMVVRGREGYYAHAQ